MTPAAEPAALPSQAPPHGLPVSEGCKALSSLVSQQSLLRGAWPTPPPTEGPEGPGLPSTCTPAPLAAQLCGVSMVSKSPHLAAAHAVLKA